MYPLCLFISKGKIGGGVCKLQIMASVKEKAAVDQQSERRELPALLRTVENLGGAVQGSSKGVYRRG